MAITAEQVKELRDQTGVSVMQCRKALEEAAGDMEKALIILRKKGSEIAEKKADRNASDGLIMIKQDDTRALALTLYCETDFVAKNERFIALAQDLLTLAWTDGADAARAGAAEKINDVVLAIGENIVLGSIEEFNGEIVGSYTHFNGKQACVVVLKGGSKELAKDIAMHAAAMKPRYLTSSDIAESDKDAVIEVLKKEVDESDKPEEIKAKMLQGKIDAYFKEQTLLDQIFFKTGDITISGLLQKEGSSITSFKLYMVG
jgi:elongation factor Ts